MITWLDPDDPSLTFPPVNQAFTEPPGLLAAGGDLRPERLLNAYQRGIFPWYETGQPILWWSPNPRAVLIPGNINLSRSLTKTLRNKPYFFSFDTSFAEVIRACAAPTAERTRTWITPEMEAAYCRLHKLGYAHSVEVWDNDESLIGGLYGVAIGKVFFGESMFSRRSDTSKTALVALSVQLEKAEFSLIDCQLPSDHLRRLGAVEIDRSRFVELLDAHCKEAPSHSPWSSAALRVRSLLQA